MVSRDLSSSFFSELIGQPQVVELLCQAIARHHIAPAYVFVGPTGVGKGLAARRFAELLLFTHQINYGTTTTLERSREGLRLRVRQGNHPDLLWVEPTYLHQGKRISISEATEMGLKRKSLPQIRLDQIREITQYLSRPPLETSRAVVVLDRAETMAEAAANALLKTLEEPGAATVILLAPSVDSLLPTLVSRCQRIPFYRLSEEAIAQVLQTHGYPELLQHPELLSTAQGSPGEAIASWNQMQTIPVELLEFISHGLQSYGLQSEQHALKIARQISRELDTDAQLWLINYLQHQLWQQYAAPEPLAILETARRHLLSYVQPQLTWEVTLMRLSDIYRALDSNGCYA